MSVKQFKRNIQKSERINKLSLSGKFYGIMQSSQELLIPETQQNSKEAPIAEMDCEQGSKEQVHNDSVHDAAASASQDSQPIAPGQRDRSDVPPPQPSSDKRLTKVTHSFVYELVKAVEQNYVSLAILEDKLETYDSIVKGQKQIPEELSIKRKTPTLAPGYNFSVTARQELETMFKVHNLEFARRLRDDLVTTVIPDCKYNCHEAEAKAERRLAHQCPPLELPLAQEIYKREVEKKWANRLRILQQRRQHQKKRKMHPHKHQPQAKRQNTSPQDVAPKFHQGRPQGARGQHHHRSRHQKQPDDRYVKAGWRQAPKGR